MFSDIGAVQSLKRLVSYSTNGTTSSLAKNALRLLREDVPRRILPCVPSWKEAEVQMWLQQIGFSQYCRRFCVRCAELPPWVGNRPIPEGALPLGAPCTKAAGIGPGQRARGARVAFWGWSACTQPLLWSVSSYLGPIRLPHRSLQFPPLASCAWSPGPIFYPSPRSGR